MGKLVILIIVVASVAIGIDMASEAFELANKLNLQKCVECVVGN